MANHPGHLSRVVAAEYDLDWLTGWSVDRSRNLIDVTVIAADGDGDRSYLAGLADSTLTLNGFWNPAAGKSDPQVDTLMDGTFHPVTVIPEGGATIGQRAVLLNVKVDDAPMSATVDGAVEMSTGRQGSAAGRGGIVLKEYDAETSTGNFASVDNSALSSFGAVGHLHVTAFTGTDATVKITDSTDDAVFADHITFTQATDVTSERLTSTGTVNRYARVELSGTFTSITFTVGFARLLQ